MDDKIDCAIQHDFADIVLTFAMIFGIIVSYIPQHLRIMKLGSSEGISPWYLFLGGLAALSNLANILILQAPYFPCYFSVSFNQSTLNLLGLAQMVAQTIMFFTMYSFIRNQVKFVILNSITRSFGLYYLHYPEELKYSDAYVSQNHLTFIHEGRHVSREWWVSLRIKRFVRYYAILLFVLILVIAMIWGYPSAISLAMAWFLGIFSTLLSLLQFLPQIRQTLRNQRIGALSIPSMAMQTPGSFIFCYTLALSPGVNISTWLTYLVGGCLQACLLLICLIFAYRNQNHPHYTQISDEAGESNEDNLDASTETPGQEDGSDSSILLQVNK